MKSTKSKAKLLDSLMADEGAVAPARARYSIGTTTVATPGNLCAIAAQAKVGKSALVGAFLGASLGLSGDTLGIGSSNPDGHALIHFDTEQSPEDHRNLIATGLRRVKTTERPTWLRSYRVAEIPVSDRLGLLEYEVKRATKIHGGVHSVLLDGVADLVLNPNDGAKAIAAVARLHALAAQFNTSIICVLHLNPGSSSKTRGHLGSQLERKSEANIAIEKHDGISTVWTQSARHSPLKKINGLRFRWNDEAQMHLTWEWRWKP